MERMLGRSRPFYKAGPVMRLAEDSRRIASREFIEARFRATGIKAGARPRRRDRRAGRQPALRRPAPRARGLGRRRGGGKTVGLDDLHGTLRRLLGEHDALFEGTWQRLTLAQRGALRAAVLEEGRELLSADVRARYRLAGRRPCRRRSRRSCATTSSPAKATATSSSTRCCGSGSRGIRTRGDRGLGIGDRGLGIGDWGFGNQGLGIGEGPDPVSTPTPGSRIPAQFTRYCRTNRIHA